MRDQRRLVIFILSGAILLVSGGVGGYLLASEDTPSPRRGTSLSEAPAQPAGSSLCTNLEQGYAIGYPAGWYTTHLSAADACRAFDPKPFQIVAGTDCCPWALVAYPAGESFERVVRGLADPMFAHVLSREDVVVAGRRALRLETEATGAGLYEAGTKTYAYVIDREGTAFLVETTQVPGIDYEARKRIVDIAVRTLRFSTPTKRMNAAADTS